MAPQEELGAGGIVDEIDALAQDEVQAEAGSSTGILEEVIEVAGGLGGEPEGTARASSEVNTSVLLQCLGSSFPSPVITCVPSRVCV